MKQLEQEVRSFRALTEKEEMTIYKIAKTYGYRYWAVVQSWLIRTA